MDNVRLLGERVVYRVVQKMSVMMQVELVVLIHVKKIRVHLKIAQGMNRVPVGMRIHVYVILMDWTVYVDNLRVIVQIVQGMMRVRVVIKTLVNVIHAVVNIVLGMICVNVFQKAGSVYVNKIPVIQIVQGMMGVNVKECVVLPVSYTIHVNVIMWMNVVRKTNVLVQFVPNGIDVIV